MAVNVESTHDLEWAETLYQPKEEVEFIYHFNYRGNQLQLKVPVNIPLKESISELTFRIVSSHNIPCYIQDDLMNSLNAFVQHATLRFNGMISRKTLGNLKHPDIKEKVVMEWLQAYSKEKKGNSSVDMVWADVYHSLIHSPALDALLRLEKSYGQAMKDLVDNKNYDMKELRDKQVLEMEEMVSYVGVMRTDDDVNALAAKQLEEAQMQEIYWSSALSELQETQKREYREWVFTVHEKTIADESFNDHSSPRLLRSPSIESHQINYDVTNQQEDYMEESFTIHLGNQMKSMHNIRLVCRDVLDYCQCKTTFVGDSMVPQPQRLQTAMTLYSDKLSAMILLTDHTLHDVSNRINKKFKDICMVSTEFHFADVEKQFCIIESTLKSQTNKQRGLLRSYSVSARKTVDSSKAILETGDFFMTKHSNLAEVHCVFHLVTDDKVASSTITSRYPIMAGMRNIMLACARHNITNLIVPLLLVHEMDEGFTVQWCLKRAELVFKCVKGFMMESLSWDGHDARTLQFVLPPGISEDLFNSISSMLPSIFRVSTTLDLSSITKK